jgi:hypothetical protein
MTKPFLLTSTVCVAASAKMWFNTASTLACATPTLAAVARGNAEPEFDVCEGVDWGITG